MTVRAADRQNYWAVRHVAALCVLLAHAFELSGKLPMDLLRVVPVLAGISGLGVTLFFIISGYLVTQSWLRHGSAPVFLWHRCLRIMPGLWGCIAFAVFLGWALSTVPASAYWQHPLLRDYVWGNLLLRNTQALPGVFENNLAARWVTGTFWTLPLEVTCYLWVLTLGVAGLLRQRILATALLLAGWLGVTLWGGQINLFDATIVPQWLPRYYGAFLSGMLLCLWRDRIFVGWLLPALLLWAVATWAWYLPETDPLWRWVDVLRVALLAWFVLNFVAWLSRFWPEPARWPDLSYGLYLYGFPIQQALVQWQPDWNGWLVFAASTLLTLLAAALSWYLIEARALQLKDRWSRLKGLAALHKG
ncbi:acyltransferase [Melaminivora sp.]